MKYISTAKMRTLDRKAIKCYGIPSLILMENAGRGIAELAQKMLRRKKRVLIVCGKGNNGGDGLVAARHLTNHGYSVQVVLLIHPKELKSDPKINYGILRKMHVPICSFTSENQATRLNILAKRSDLIIDGIFGIGLERPVSGFFYDVISILNDSQKPVLAIDIPSGLNSDSGVPLGIAIKAKATGTLGIAKRGPLVWRGPRDSGKVSVLDISIPAS